MHGENTNETTFHPVFDTIGYVITQVCRAHRNRAQSLLEELGLHTGQEMFLSCLWEQDGLTQTELCERLGVQPATVCKMLERLHTAGLVASQKDVQDGRVSRVYLSAAGKNLQDAVGSTWLELERQTFAHMSPEEKMLFRRLLLQILDNLK